MKKWRGEKGRTGVLREKVINEPIDLLDPFEYGLLVR